MSKLLVIVGATGNQGGSVIKSILGDPKATEQFRLRGITRDTSKPAAQALTKQGVEMVSADLGDKASIAKAFEGAWGVFAVTDYWATMKKEVEVKQGKALADAAKVSVPSDSCFPVYHYDKKTDGFRKLGSSITSSRP